MATVHVDASRIYHVEKSQKHWHWLHELVVILGDGGYWSQDDDGDSEGT